MPEHRTPTAREIIEFYKGILQEREQESEEYEFRGTYFGTYKYPNIEAALEETFCQFAHGAFVHSTVKKRAIVLFQSLLKNDAFVHEKGRASWAVAMMYVKLNGYEYTEQTWNPDEDIESYINRCCQRVH